MKTIAQVVIGYMYKVLKSGKPIVKYKKEFAAIRHGDYATFLNLIGKPIEFIVTYNAGIISTDVAIGQDDFDFGSLLKSAKSLKLFHQLCINEYGQINDENLADSVFDNVALFELSLRMHRNNLAPREDFKKLETVIEELSVIKKLTREETEILHRGRRFLNYVKRPEKMKTNWSEGVSDFNQALELIKKKGLVIL